MRVNGHRDESGAVAVMVAILLVVMVGMLALTVDGGLLWTKFRAVRRVVKLSAGRLSNQLLEQIRLAAVGADVPRVEQLPAPGLDEERVGVERRVVVEVRGELEGPQDEALPMPQEASGRDVDAHLGEEGRLTQDAQGRFAQVDRHAARYLGEQSVVIEVRMGNNDTQERGVDAAREPGHRGQRQIDIVLYGQGPAEIQDDAGTVVLDLYTVATDLVGTSMNADPHGLPRNKKREKRPGSNN